VVVVVVVIVVGLLEVEGSEVETVVDVLDADVVVDVVVDVVEGVVRTGRVLTGARVVVAPLGLGGIGNCD
jgi:hypothetical protein